MTVYQFLSAGLNLRRAISPRGGCVALVSLQSSGFPTTAEMLTFRRQMHKTVVYATPDDSPLASLRGRKTDMRLCSSSLHKRGSGVRSLEDWGRWKTETKRDGSVPPQRIRENMKVQEKNVQYRNIICRFPRLSYSLCRETLYLPWSWENAVGNKRNKSLHTEKLLMLHCHLKKNKKKTIHAWYIESLTGASGATKGDNWDAVKMEISKQRGKPSQ